MAKHKHIYYIGVYYNGEGEPRWHISEWPMESDVFTLVSGPHTVELEVPNDFPRDKIAENLDLTIDKIRAVSEQKITEMVRAKQNLLAVSYDKPAASEPQDDDFPF